MGARNSLGEDKSRDRSVIEAVVFDMDGLMVDSEPLSRRVWDEILAEHGYLMEDEVYDQMVGRRTRESAEIVLEAYALPFTVEALAAHKIALWEEVWRNQSLPPMPGLHELLEALERRGLPWAVATSSPRAYAGQVLTYLNSMEQCQAIVGGDEVVNGKPAPDIYLLAARRLGIPVEKCLALEDSVPGGRAAKAAGMTLAAVPGTTATVHEFDFADCCFPSLREVLSRLEELLSGNCQ